jgi:biotin carboxyl carrier protein
MEGTGAGRGVAECVTTFSRIQSRSWAPSGGPHRVRLKPDTTDAGVRRPGMRFQIEIAGRTRDVIVTRAGDGFAVTVDRRRLSVDAVRTDRYTLSLLVDNGCSHEVVVVPDAASAQLTVRVGATEVAVGLDGRRRMGSRRGAAAAGSGPQHVVAPMPGKVVRVPVAAGDSVRAGQPVVVVEAMKMENELRAGRDGVVAAVHAREGMSVEAGALLVVIQ